MNSISPNKCTVFVQVWVDVNALQPNSTQGCYAVCNRSMQSKGEGTANLQTEVPTGSFICWSVLPIDPQFEGTLEITNVGTQTGWSAAPAQYGDEQNVYTGQVNVAYVDGVVDSNIQFNYNGSTGPGQMSVTLPVAITPQKPRVASSTNEASEYEGSEYEDSEYEDSQAPDKVLQDAEAANPITPLTVINVAVDTQYLYSQPPSSTPYQGVGIYMMDNQYSSTSNEGTLELNTQVSAGDAVGFNVFAINKLKSNAAKVSIVGYETSSGTHIFKGKGEPQAQDSGNYQWIGTPSAQGSCTYQLKIAITPPSMPTQYYFWDPFMTCNS